MNPRNFSPGHKARQGVYSKLLGNAGSSNMMFSIVAGARCLASQVDLGAAAGHSTS
jgi:hypothetical protein